MLPVYEHFSFNYAAARSSLSAPRITILRARHQLMAVAKPSLHPTVLASKHRAPHPWSNITGIAFECIGAIIAFGW